MKIQKTNVARLLDKAKVSYELIPYEVDENDLAAQHVAEELGEDLHQVFKTIVLHGDKTGYLVCVLPGNCEVNLKKAAKVSGNKKVETIPMKELPPPYSSTTSTSVPASAGSKSKSRRPTSSGKAAAKWPILPVKPRKTNNQLNSITNKKEKNYV